MSDTSLGPGPDPENIGSPIPLTDLRAQIRAEIGLPAVPDAEDRLPYRLKYDELVVRNRDTGELRVIRDRQYMHGDWEVVRQATYST